MVLTANNAAHRIPKCGFWGKQTAKSIPICQRMELKLQLGRVIILWGDVGFETFLETLNDFHDPFKPSRSCKRKENCRSLWLTMLKQHEGLGWIICNSWFRLPDETENRTFEWNNSILQNVKIELWKLGYGLISGISGPTKQHGLNETNVWFLS